MKTTINSTDLEFLKSYVETPSPSGHETAGQKVWLDFISPFVDEYFTDISGSVAAVINPSAKFKVLIEAHVDQVCYYVNYISKEGNIFVTKIGGADPVIAPSKRVRIHTKNGDVPGVFGWAAVHVREKNQNTPTETTIYIEAGCSSKKEVLDLGIDIGCPVTYDETLQVLNNKVVTGPALDNKIGGYVIAKVAKKLSNANVKLPYSLYIVNSVLEETGMLGASIMGNKIRPDVAIITDVTHDTQSPMYDKKKYGDIAIGRGPVLTFAPTVQKNLLNMIFNVAEKQDIPYQKKAASKSTGTDDDAFFTSDSGVASALVALPMKYMHTTAETVAMRDVNAAIELIYHFLIQLPEHHDFRTLK